MTWRSITEKARALAGLIALTGCQSIPEASLEQADVLIMRGQIFDGTGNPAQSADIAIRDDKIIFVGSEGHRRFQVDTVIDAIGLVVAPGFIDPHTHAGSDLASEDDSRRANLAFAFQGVTTVVVGNDGHGSTRVREMAEKANNQGIGTNVAYLAGFGYLRKQVIGNIDRAPTKVELERMKTAMTGAMCEGAYGLSAGLYYTPQNFAKTDEVITLAKVAARFGGYYDTHMRDESTYNIGVAGALREAIEISRQSGAPLHVSHIKALGPAVWGHSARMITLIEDARAEGMKITADQYPWTASGTRISNALMPRWSLSGGLEGLRTRLKSAETRKKIQSEIVQNLERRGGASRLLITAGLGEAEVTVGKNLAEIADAQGIDPVLAAVRIVEKGDARVASFNMNPDDIKAFAQRNWVVTGSDGSTGHPRKYASFPKAYQDFVVRDQLLSLAQFIRRSSGQTADITGLKDRGYLKAGMVADIVLFDPKKFSPRATYQLPTELTAGVVHLFVNGVRLIENGEYRGALPGQPLLKDNQC
ncbi:amidohydrolase family protein [Parasphingorhabdus sp.]|uniref:N-acyl-D-amino-acid deacylase family protein n=1 Tax=Parasphingorhabdus sp. TaxID=2709688 RepID=UPI0032633936